MIGILKNMSDDISWTEAKDFPYAGTFIGLDNVTKNVFSRLGSEWVDYKFNPEGYVASDDEVVAFVHTRAHALSLNPSISPNN